MNGIAQMFRALVLESTALVLLFCLVFGKAQQPEASDTRSSTPPSLSIATAPAAGREAAERVLLLRRDAEQTASSVFQRFTAWRRSVFASDDADADFADSPRLRFAMAAPERRYKKPLMLRR